ncbi:hypothetical protein BKA69DRAFT_290189 [Paraphysoderma sedebokerense]|nr:hypothetical protein BKA69DRAFT_290189 [Paraphysoderma sedebokerense]
MQLRGYKTAIDADVRLEPSNEKVEIAAEQTKTSQQEPSITAPASLEQTTSSVVARIPERINNSITEFTVIASSRLIQQRDIVCELDRNSVNLLERDFSYLSVRRYKADIIIDERSCIVCYPISYLSQQIDPHAPEGNGLRSLGSAQLLDVLSRLGSRYEYITIVLEGYSKSVGVSTGMQRIGESSLKTYPFTPPHQEGLCELQQIIPSIATYFDVKINILYSMSPSESAWIIRKSCEIAVRRVEHLTAGDVTGDIESENGNKSRYSRQCALGWKNKEQWLDRSWMNSELTTVSQIC